jgi:(2Fe-2S) ferredoxin
MASTKYRAYLCCGPNCGPKGSGALLDFLASEVDRLGIGDDVSVLPTGCQSHCESGPTMVVYPGPIYYQSIDQQRLTEIASEHLRDGVPVQEYFWRGEPLRIRPKTGSTYGSAFPSRPLPSITSHSAHDDRTKKTTRKQDVDDFKW